MVQAKIWTLAKHFEGFPADRNFELKVEELPEPKDGGKIVDDASFFQSTVYSRR